MKEKWKHIVGFTDYKISNIGNVYSIKSNKFLKPYLNKGYLTVKLHNEVQILDKKIHILVAEHFLKKKSNRVVDHIDNNSFNNLHTNLQYITQRENTKKDKDKEKFGVTFDVRTNHWVTRIFFQGKNLCLGSFKSKEQGEKEYTRALKEIEESNKVTICTPANIRKTSKYKGVSYDSKRNKWLSYFTKNSKQIKVGRFDLEKEAYNELIKMKEKYGA